MKARARSLRRTMTDAEQRLWRHLRARHMDGHKFRRQHPIGPYIADFVCLEMMLILEADGGQHAERVDQDAQRIAYLQRQGYTVLRFWNHEILADTDAVLERIHAELQRCSAQSAPDT